MAQGNDEKPQPKPDGEPPDAATLAERIGRVICGKWTLERLIGAGGMAAVYAARHEIGRHEAIKILHPEVALDKELVARLKREAHAVNRFSHPGVVEIRDVDVSDEGEPFLVMELLEGESLARRLKRGPLEVDEALRVAEELCDVLVAAHAEGVIHRDIKPSNLFIEKDGRVRVLDFGVAQLKRGPGTLVTEAGTAIGTVAYMPPEQLRGDAIDHRADLYAVGATLFRLIGNEKVHGALEEAQLAQKLLTEPARPLHTVAPDVPMGAQLIVDRALAFLPERRYPDAATMLADVKAARAGEPPPYATARVEEGDDPRDTEPKAAPPLRGTLSGADEEGWKPPVDAAADDDKVEAEPAAEPAAAAKGERRDEDGRLLRADTEDGRTEPMTRKRPKKNKAPASAKAAVAKTLVDEGDEATTHKRGKTQPGVAPDEDEARTVAMKRSPATAKPERRWAADDGPPSRPTVERKTATRFLPLLVVVVACVGIWYWVRPRGGADVDPVDVDKPASSPRAPAASLRPSEPAPPAPSPNASPNASPAAPAPSPAPETSSSASPQPPARPPTPVPPAPSSSTSPFPFPSGFPTSIPTAWPSALPWPTASQPPKSPPPPTP
jgi:serine/threonine-protein kinase